MATSPVPMFDPTGTVRMIQPEQVDAATQSGGIPAVKMIDPEGNQRYVRQDQVDDALAANGKIAPPDMPTAPQEPTSLLGKEVNFVQGLPGMQMASGAMKGLEKTAAGGLEAINKYVIAPQDPGATATTQRVSNAVQGASNWLRKNTDTQGWEKVGDIGEGIGELLYAPELAEAEGAKGLSYAQQLLQHARKAKILEEFPALAQMARIGLSTVRGAGEVGGQSFVKSGGDIGQTKAGLEAGALGGSLGGAVTEDIGTAMQKLAGKAGELMPDIENLGSGDYRVLRSEATGPQGQNVSTPLQREAASIANRPEIRAERIGAFQQMPGNIAQTGLANALRESESARMAGPFASEPPISSPTVANVWDHTTPDGRSLNPDEAREELANIRSQWLSEDNDPAVEQQLEQQYGALKNKLTLHDRFNATAPPTGPGTLSPDDARAALDNLKTRWLAEEWGPQQDAQFKQAYNTLQQQVDRNESYQMNRTMTQPFDIQNALDNTSNLDDAAHHLDLAARQRLQYLTPELQQQYQMLNATRTHLQDMFDRAAGTPIEQARILPQINAANSQLENFFKQDGVRGVLPRSEAEQALIDLRRANGFKALDNVFSKHLNLQPETAAAIGEPSMPRGSMANDIEDIRNQYGDVLDPVLGDQGLNHIIKMGQRVDMPTGRDAVTGLLGNIADSYKRHFLNINGLAGAIGAGTLYGLGVHAVGLAALPASVATASITGARRYVIQRMASDPAFGRAVMYAAERGIPPRIAAAMLATRLGFSKLVAPLFSRQPPPPETTNANSQ